MFLRRLLSNPTTTSLPPNSLRRLLPTPTSSLSPHPNLLLFKAHYRISKLPKKYRRKRKKPESARTRRVQPEPTTLPPLESIVLRDTHFRFLLRSKQFIAKQPHQVLLLTDAPRQYQALGFPRGRNIMKFIDNHPLLYRRYRGDNDNIWVGFTPLMLRLLGEEDRVFDEMEAERVNVIRKLLMMSKDKRIGLSKIYHNRMLFGIREDLMDWFCEYPDYFRVVEEDGRRVVELVEWDPSLAVSALEREFFRDEEKVKRMFTWPVAKVKSYSDSDSDLESDEDDDEDEDERVSPYLDEEEERTRTVFNTLPLVSPYTDGSKLGMSTLEAEKYRVGLIHEFLSLTLEKRAYIHNIVEFKEEFSLTKHTYMMLKKQPQTFYLAGTEMNWCVFLKDAYGEDGCLIHKDPHVLFHEKLFKYAEKKEFGPGDEVALDAVVSK